MTAIQIFTGGQSTTHPIPAGKPLVIGSGPSADVRVGDPAFEAQHLKIESTPAGIRVNDLGTRQGTRLNGLFVSQALLKLGDEISVGDTLLVIVKGGAAGTPTAKPVEEIPTVPPIPAGKPKPAAARPAKARPVAKPAGRAPKAKPKPASATGARPAPRRELEVEARPRASARPAPKKRSRALPVVVVVLLLAVSGALLFVLQGESKRESAAAGAYAKAQADWDAGDREGAERTFREVVETWPDTPSAPRAAKALEAIAKEWESEKAAAAALGELKERWTQLTFEDLGDEHREIVSKYPGTAVAKDAAFLAGMEEKYRVERKRRFEDTRQRALALVKAGRYYDAVLTWHEYIYLPSNIPPDITAATSEFQTIQKRAASAFKSVADQAEKLIAAEKFDEVVALLSNRLEEFRGTRHAFEIRQKLALVDVLRAGGGEEIEAAVVEERIGRRQEFLKIAEDAEGLVRRRLYADAVALLERGATDCPHEDLAAEFRARAGDLEGYAALFTSLRGQIREHPERFRAIDLGHGFRANAVGADQDRLTVKVRNAESRLEWSRLSPARLLSLLSRLKLDALGQLRLARFAFEAGDEEAGHKAMTVALKGDESLTQRAFELLARVRRIPVPDDGFVLHRGRWLTPAEKTAAELRDRIDDAERAARSGDERKRGGGLAELREIGDPALPALLRALTYQSEAAVEALVNHPIVRDGATKQLLFKQLKDRRKAALALIFDTVKYPYPHPEGAAYDAVQAEVDDLVDAVRIIWERPVTFLTQKYPEVMDLYGRAEKFSLELTALGHPPEVPFEKLIDRANRSIDMPRFAPDSTSKSALEWNDKVAKYHQEIQIDADAAERECMDAVNEYRAMMGLKAVKWNDKLLVAARGHSTEMRVKGFFAHNIPLPGAEYDDHRTPTQRARKAGYGGGVSENIARGSTNGRATFKQWYKSSGHHRNMLGGRHVELGVGRSEDFWTQNFGSASRAFDLPKKKVDPPAGKDD